MSSDLFFAIIFGVPFGLFIWMLVEIIRWIRRH